MSVRLKPMQILCKFIGVAPYSFDPGSSKTKFKTSKFGIIYSSVIAALLTWFAVINYETISTHQISQSHVTITAQWLKFCINNGFSVLIVIANSLQQWKVVKCPKIQQVFNQLFDTNDNQPKEILDQEKFHKDIFHGTAMVIITIFLHLLTTLTSYFDNHKVIDYYWVPNGILFLLNTLVVLQFLCGVVKVGQKIQALNVRLEGCINERMVIARYKNAEMINLEVNEVAKDHLELVDETNLLISAFSYQLLLSFVAALIVSVSGLYLVIKRIIQYTVAASIPSIGDTDEKDYDWWCLTCYPLLHSILVGSIIGVCNWTIIQTDSLKGIALRVQRVVQLSESSSAITGFCHQLLLQQISFNVFRIFTISPSMICSIISTVLTYMTILVQFELSQDIGKTRQADLFNSEAAVSNFSYEPYENNSYGKYE